MLSMSKISKIDQIHLRAVMLCMLKMLKMGKEHTHTFLNNLLKALNTYKHVFADNFLNI